MAYLTGIRVPAKTQQRLVHRQTFATPAINQPMAELSVDGGKVRLRTPVGETSEWRDYKAIATDLGMVANFHNNARLIEWINEQLLAQTVTCPCDGHDGVWKQAKNFCKYLRKHHCRIVNYDYFQAEGLCSIGSGAAESAIKQIDRRIQLSGAQWNAENVPQILAHRCAYLNGLIGSQVSQH